MRTTGSQKEKPGSDLLSHAVTSIVPSALMGLTSLFGMGRGVSPSVKPPGISKFEALNPKFETISKFKILNKKLVWVFWISSFGFVSGFDIRISNFQKRGGR